MAYNAHIHHRRSIRVPDYDYRSAGAYHITICTFKRQCLFDDNALRSVVEQVWEVVVNGDGVPDVFVVMPNHVHGIIWISPSTVGAQQSRRSPPRRGRSSDDPSPASHTVAAPLRRPAVTRGVASGSLGAIVRAFKSATTKRISNLRGTRGAPVWQRNYYEHIVRGEDDLFRVRQYIRDNPAKWADDPENPANSPATARRGAATARTACEMSSGSPTK